MNNYDVVNLFPFALNSDFDGSLLKMAPDELHYFSQAHKQPRQLIKHHGDQIYIFSQRHSDTLMIGDTNRLVVRTS